MKLSLRLELPRPCAKDWDKMAPAERGRHCEHCCKTVVDFTQMSDEEIMQFFLEAARPREKRDAGKREAAIAAPHAGICGRFLSDQLGRELAPSPVQRNGWSGWKWMIAGSLVLSKGPQGARTTPPPARIVGSEKPVVIPDGDRSKQGAPVLVGDTAIAVMSGEVEIKQADTGSAQMGKVAAPRLAGATPNAERPDTNELPADIVRAWPTSKQDALTGDVIVVRSQVFDSMSTDTPSLLTQAVDTALNLIRDTAAVVIPALRRVDVVRLYPNPVTRGGRVSLAWDGAPGRRQVMLVSATGQVVAQRLVEVAGKGQVDEWVLPQGLAAGLYFVRIAQEGKKVQAVELLVQ